MRIAKSYTGTFGGATSAVAGKDGKSAYEIAVEYGFNGTEEEWLESLGGSEDMCNVLELSTDDNILNGDSIVINTNGKAVKAVDSGIVLNGESYFIEEALDGLSTDYYGKYKNEKFYNHRGTFKYTRCGLKNGDNTKVIIENLDMDVTNKSISKQTLELTFTSDEKYFANDFDHDSNRLFIAKGKQLAVIDCSGDNPILIDEIKTVDSFNDTIDSNWYNRFVWTFKGDKAIFTFDNSSNVCIVEVANNAITTNIVAVSDISNSNMYSFKHNEDWYFINSYNKKLLKVDFENNTLVKVTDITGSSITLLAPFVIVDDKLYTLRTTSYGYIEVYILDLVSGVAERLIKYIPFDATFSYTSSYIRGALRDDIIKLSDNAFWIANKYCYDRLTPIIVEVKNGDISFKESGIILSADEVGRTSNIFGNNAPLIIANVDDIYVISTQYGYSKYIHIIFGADINLLNKDLVKVDAVAIGNSENNKVKVFTNDYLCDKNNDIQAGTIINGYIKVDDKYLLKVK